MKKRAPRLRIKFGETVHSSSAVEPSHPRPVVLVLDDDPTIRLMIKVLLEVAAGVRILEAETSKQAMKLAEHFRLDLLLSNLARPSTREGLEFLRTFRVAYPQVPVVVVSGALDPTTRIRAIKFGASGCVTKLLATSKLLEVVRSILSARNKCDVSSRLARREGAWIHHVKRCVRGRWRKQGHLGGD